jgi:hypothetical protein
MWLNGHLSLAFFLKNKVEKIAPHYTTEPVFSLYKAGAGSRHYLRHCLLAETCYDIRRTTLAALKSDYVAARVLSEQCLTIMKALNDKEDMELYLLGLAEVDAALGEPVWAARLWGAAEVLSEASGGAPIPPVEHAAYEQAVDAARAQLGEQAFAVAWAQGRAMSPEQALTAQGQMVFPTPGELP